MPSGWRNSPGHLQHRAYRIGDRIIEVRYSMTEDFQLDGVGTVAVRAATTDEATIEVGDRHHRFEISRYGADRHVDSEIGPAHLVELPRFPERATGEARGSLHAPMPGKVIRVEVEVGATVEEGQALVVMEAMKMEHTLRSPHHGRVSQVSCAPGDQVEAEAVLVIVDEPGR